MTTRATELWDAIVIGAGPGGATAALLLARRGWRVLLLERSNWPRDKVCGGCLNARAIALLESIGVLPAIANLATPIHRTIFRNGRSTIELRRTGGIAIARRDLDASLVECAIHAGAVFEHSSRAKLLPGESDESRDVMISRGGDSKIASAKIVLACDGIGGNSIAEEPWAKWKIARDSWIGSAITIPKIGDESFPRDAIQMHIGKGGYIGAVRLADGSLHLGAALSAKRSRESGGMNNFVKQILEESGGDSLFPKSARFAGTPQLTRRRSQLGGRRVLALGDACGYVEPFTGEGISWALESACRATEMIIEAREQWPSTLADRWTQQHRETIGNRQKWCKIARFALHRPLVTRAMFGVFAQLPRGLDEIATRVQSPLELEPVI